MRTKAANEKRQKQARDPKKAIKRFMEKVEKQKNGCWLWTGARSGAGSYGFFWLNGRLTSAHRAAHILFKGPIPPGRFAMHSCDDRECVNPKHISAGTPQDNSLDMVRKGRSARGDRSGSSTIAEDQVRLMKGEYQARDGELARLANKYNVTISTVSQIVTGASWAHVEVPLGSVPTTDAPHQRALRGSRHHKAKLTERQVRQMRVQRAAGAGVTELATKYGIQKAQASAILSGRYWKHVGGPLVN